MPPAEFNTTDKFFKQFLLLMNINRPEVFFLQEAGKLLVIAEKEPQAMSFKSSLVFPESDPGKD